MLSRRLRGFALLALLMGGLGLIGQGGYIKVKAVVANWLIASTWDDRTVGIRPIKPWSWADTTVVAQLQVPRLGVEQFVMQDASGESLAFGPGSVVHGVLPGDLGASMIAGHRDTHFRFLSEVQTGDEILVKNFSGVEQTYRVTGLSIFDTRNGEMALEDEMSLTLVTCWPFEALVPGGPLRYVVKAMPVDSVVESASLVLVHNL